jgi:hypothetical protein
MNDLEEHIRAILDDEALGAPRVTRAPDGLRRRVRRVQLFTGLAATGSITGIGVLILLAAGLVSGDVQMPASVIPAGRPVSTAFPEVRITYPDGWQVTGTPYPAGSVEAYQPIDVRLTNFEAPEHGTNWGWVCANGTVRGESHAVRFPDAGVMLWIDVGNGPVGAEAPRWPQDLVKSDQCAPYANSPFGGETWTAEWSLDGITPMSAVAVFGPDATVADRQRVFDAFASLGFPGGG